MTRVLARVLFTHVANFAYRRTAVSQRHLRGVTLLFTTRIYPYLVRF
jgi:hypothetical protein